MKLTLYPFDIKEREKIEPSYARLQRERAAEMKELRLKGSTIGSSNLAAKINDKYQGSQWCGQTIHDVEYNRVLITQDIYKAWKECCKELTLVP